MTSACFKYNGNNNRCTSEAMYIKMKPISIMAISDNRLVLKYKC